MPVLLFVMQEGCRAALNDEGLSEIMLPPYLVEVFQSGIVALVVEAQHVTYITGLNSSLNSLVGEEPEPAPTAVPTPKPVWQPTEEPEFTFAPTDEPTAEPTLTPTEEPVDEPTIAPTDEPTAEPTLAPTEEPVAEATEEPDYVGLYASNTAKKAVEAQELANVISILVNSVQPQAANLLRDKFPAFQEAAENGEISSQIGMYVYYQRSDGDTLGHWTPDGAYALVQNHSIEHDDGSVAMGTLVSYNVYDIMTEDEDGREVLNQDPGAWMHFGGSVLHEFMHAFMSDYNRVGTTGSNDPEYDNPNSDPHDEDVEYYSRLMLSQLMFPDWFREGTAATMDYNYSFYGNYFQKFKAQNTGDDLPAYSADSIFDTYTKTIYFYPFYDLQSPGTDGSNYVSGYMAVLYLSELAAAGNEALGSSVSTGEDGKTVVDSEKLRLGLNDILKKLHNGETLDQVIAEVSGGAYADANDFEARFIKGTEEQGDEASLAFCANLLNYLEEVSGPDGKGITGSILFDFADQESIDPTKKEESDLFNVIGCNVFVESDADISVPYTDGGYHKRGDEVHTNAEVVEYTAGLVAMEWAEKLEGIDN